MKAKIEKRWYTNSNGGRPAEWDNEEHGEVITVAEFKAIFGDKTYRDVRSKLTEKGDWESIYHNNVEYILSV